MKKIIISGIMIAAILTECYGQTVAKTGTGENWLRSINEMGVEKKNDSLYISEEVVRLLKDVEYRKTIYPAVYSWPVAVDLLNKMELKKACWQMINLFEKDSINRNVIIGTLVLYDSLVDMDKVLLNTFYTYAFTDSEVCRITNNKPEIYRPDILEKKLRLTKDIIGYIWGYRKQRVDPAKNN